MTAPMAEKRVFQHVHANPHGIDRRQCSVCGGYFYPRVERQKACSPKCWVKTAKPNRKKKKGRA